ncbi:MAG TPA: PBP1A family penicillin-binding protein [Myxococcaceae bacterium]
MRRLLKRLLVLMLAGVVLLAVAGVGGFFYFDRNLPSVESLRTYQPPQVTKVRCADGSVCAEYYLERRTVVPIASLPQHVRNVFLAAEDADFYKHQGLDPFGMARAAIKSLLPGGRVTGASTITQQACRSILLSQERTFGRKAREWILSVRMEKALTKDQILELYLNQIVFGHARYGVEEAAVYYFGKHAKDLSMGEAAVLAGVLPAPERFNPVTNTVRARERQKYVLNQLVSKGFYPEAQVAPERVKPIVLGPRPPERVGPYYAEEVRRTLVARYGEAAILSGGMRVDIAMDPKLQAFADLALREGLEELDRKMGYRGPVGKLDPDRFKVLAPMIQKRIAEAGKRKPDEVKVADLTPLAPQPSAESASGQESDEGVEAPRAVAVEEGEEPPPSPDELLSQQVSLRVLSPGLRAVGYVTQVDDAGKKAVVDLVGKTAKVDFATSTWARPRGIGKWTQAPSRMSDVMKVGDLVRVRVMKVTPGAEPLEATLDQVPEVQGALLAINPANRYVVAMSGGSDFRRSPFNRATQAKRQPGSSFKPFLYAAALASTRYTAITQVNDAPEMIRDPYTGKTWKPQNYEKGGYEGPMTLRAALTRSKNTVSVRLIEDLTPAAAIDFARRAGISSTLPDNLTLALGTGEVAVLELANAYATLQSMGKYADPIEIVRVTDARGTVVEEHQAVFEERMQPAVAFLTTSLMRSVVEEGTAMQVRELNRPAAGKTGTASEYRDAWFSGYTTDLVTTAWVGFDDHTSLGGSETGTGGRAALPIWLRFMKDAEGELPVRDFEVPSGVQQVRIDPVTGLLAGRSVPGRMESFLDGTAPTAEAPPPGNVDPSKFLYEDGRGGGL